jgi:hypothetical protein
MNKEETHYKIKKLIKGYEKRQENVQEAYKRASKTMVESDFSPDSIATTFEIDTLNAEEALIAEFIEDLKGLMDE